MLTALGIIIALIIVLSLLALFIPMVIIGKSENKDFRGRFKWGIFTFSEEDDYSSLHIGKWNVYRKKKKEDEKRPADFSPDELIPEKIVSETAEKPSEKKNRKLKTIISRWETAYMLLSKLTELLRRIIMGIRIETLRLEVRDFPSEPHLAGTWYGFYYAAVYPNLPSNITVIYEPFEKSEIKAKTETHVEIYLYRILLSLLWFLITVPKLETIGFIRSLKKT
ncbi:MAG: hypothetical protein GF307_04675 [candidate division Zixibacteria bacterium]|nr:hypothetical protein [candidate division Zixibacteria bacterium]